MLALAAVLAAVAALSIWLARLAHTDGGPARACRPFQEDWDDDLPAQPYNERIHP